MSKPKKKVTPPIPQGPNKRMQKELAELRTVVIKLVEQNNGHVEHIEDVIERQTAQEAKVTKIITLLKSLPSLELKHDLSAMEIPSTQALDENFDTIKAWGAAVSNALKELEA